MKQQKIEKKQVPNTLHKFNIDDLNKQTDEKIVHVEDHISNIKKSTTTVESSPYKMFQSLKGGNGLSIFTLLMPTGIYFKSKNFKTSMHLIKYD